LAIHPTYSGLGAISPASAVPNNPDNYDEFPENRQYDIAVILRPGYFLFKCFFGLK
jgi:hypothetical protein